MSDSIFITGFHLGGINIIIFLFIFQIYWIGPIIGAICAGAAYHYIYCPDAEFKQYLKEALKKATQKTKGKYIEVDDNRSQMDTDDIIHRGIVHVIDIEHEEGKKGKDSESEILSTV